MHHAHDAYLESRIVSAEPVELVRVLYQTCLGEVREARRRLASGNIPGRAKSISKACEIVMELIASLDRDRGGDIGHRLLRLYDYLLRKLVEANFRQSDAALAEVLELMTTLLEGWDGAKAQTESAPAEQNRWMPVAGETEAMSSNAWSF